MCESQIIPPTELTKRILVCYETARATAQQNETGSFYFLFYSNRDRVIEVSRIEETTFH